MNDLKNQESYTFYEDSAHGWLKVPFHELRYLNIVDDISEQDIKKDKNFKDYGASSLDIVEIVSGVMRELKIKKWK